SVLVCLYSPVSPTPPRSTLFPYTTLFRSAAGGQHRAVAAEQVQRALAQVQRQHAAAGAVGVHDQVESEVFDEEFGVVRQRLLVQDRKSTRLNSSHVKISYAVFCLKKKTEC